MRLAARFRQHFHDAEFGPEKSTIVRMLNPELSLGGC